jgi:peptidoglycan-associated lipoprotein
MRQPPAFAMMISLAAALLFAQGCATQLASGNGDQGGTGEELISEPIIKDIPPKKLGVTATRKSPAMRAELSARHATGLPKGSLTDILFDFDRASLRVEALPVLEENAKRLRDGGVRRLLLEGRGDEVGTAAYNLVLGERRARNVQAYLQQLGLSTDVKTMSYGKDRPLCLQHTSECMQTNRSVHFVVKD